MQRLSPLIVVDGRWWWQASFCAWNRWRVIGYYTSDAGAKRAVVRRLKRDA